MKKIVFIAFAFILLCLHSVVYSSHQNIVYAQTPTPTLDPSIANGDWLPDTDVTFQGKTASRSALLMNLVLQNYQWVNTGVNNGDAPLINFWTKIRNIVYGILLLVLLAAAFAIIITGGKSLTAWKFARRFIIMVILIWFSYALCRFLYEFVDIIIGFFNRNPEGNIITSKDLFNMSFNYQDFIGLRRFGTQYNESAFVSLLLVRLTAITYYVMAGILLVRKIILWFFIAVSPIYPLLLFHFPIRNTAKIWIGEFFRWLLYAPLFFIFLSSLVIIWRNNISLFPFNFGSKPIVYPTAINILLGGPGQQLTVDNSVNYNDTFAEYIIALIMLWIVIFLPFILLRIFLDYLWSLNIDKDNGMNFIQNIVKRVPGNQFLFPNAPVAPSPSIPPPGTRPTGMAKPIIYGTTGAARELPTGEKREIYVEKTREIEKPVQTTVQANVQVTLPVYKSEKVSVETAKLVSFPIPRMRDIARYESNRMSSQIAKRQVISRMHETLEKIANPQAITNSIEKQQFTQLREKLLQQSQKGEPLATSILAAASNVTRVSGQTSVTQVQAVSNVQSVLQKVDSPESISNSTEKQQYTNLKNQLIQQSKQGDSYATTITNLASNITQLSKQNNQSAITEVHQTLEKIANPESITSPEERQKYLALKTQLQERSVKGDTVAKSILTESDNLAKAKQVTAQATLPQQNQVQTVNLEDYEEVKRTWLENYKKMEVPKTADATQRSRKQWVETDLNHLSNTIEMLTSKDQQKIDEGMKEVSSLLPFLLIGGFSQTEVVSYLQAKKHAAEEALVEMKESEQEEETLVSARRKETSTKQMASSVSVNNDFTNTEDDEDDNPISQIVNNYSQRIKTISQMPKLKSEQTSTPVMKLVNFTVPTMLDVVRFESAKVNDEKTQQEIKTVNEMLEKLANPEAITDASEKQQFVEMKRQITQAGQKGDPLANSILFTLNTFTQKNPQSALPKKNAVQTVNLDDYEEVRSMWKEIYKSEVPVSADKPDYTRKEWIQEDITKIDNTVMLLKSEDPLKVEEGMKIVGNILPFLLIGGFSDAEVIAYLQAKKQAGEDVLQELADQEGEEESKVTVQTNKSEDASLKSEAKLDGDKSDEQQKNNS